MKNIAIIVGNSEYRHSANLDCCLADVDAITNLLHTTDKYDSIKTLKNKNAADLKDAVRNFLEDSDAVEDLFFYFSGHGYQHNGEFFYNATDFDTSRPNETGLSYSELHTLLRATNAKLVVKVINSCSSGTLILKSDGGFLPEPKGGITNFIQIASCLENQTSLTGDPLSAFTDSFYNAALSKNAGVVYYSDIISALRDRYLDNNAQTPHFIVQGTGREIFAENATRLNRLREERQKKISAGDKSRNADLQKDELQLSDFDQIKALEKKYVSKDAAQNYISELFKKTNSALEAVNSYEDYFEYKHDEYDDYVEIAAKSFIVQVLSKEKRADNFVAAEISRERPATTFSQLATTFRAWPPSTLFSADDVKTDYNLYLNCSIEIVQFKATFVPKFQSLKQFSLIVSCAPSLETCYVFEVLTRHALSDWGTFEAEGDQVNRRWYKLAWEESADGIVKKFQTSLQKTIDDHIHAVLEHDASSRDG